MDRSTLAIHQITSNLRFGDGISNGIIFTQKMIKELGYQSEIYVYNKTKDPLFTHPYYYIDDYCESHNNIILYHHASGDDEFHQIMALIDKKIIIYHNITPAHFYNGESYQLRSEKGMEQLRQSAALFVGSIGDSDYNSNELCAYGYPNPITIPLLVDLEKETKPVLEQTILNKYSDSFNILFVGRIIQNKCQHQLIDVMYSLKLQGISGVRLFIVGNNHYSDYWNYLHDYAKKLGLSDNIIITGRISDEELHSYYKIASLYLSMSEHEGFAMPIIEAIKSGIPALAYGAGAIPTTMGNEGVFYYKDSSKVAADVGEIMNNKKMRKNLIAQQAKQLNKYSYQTIKNNLNTYLNNYL